MRLTRRGFLVGAVAAASAPLIIPGRALGAEGATAPSERINLGVVGCGARGSGHAQRFAEMDEAQVVAVCDVYKNKRDEVARTVNEYYAAVSGSHDYNGCKTYNDFREMVANPDVDAIVVATPDHWHVLPALEAVRAGKGVYIEKPMTLTIEEGRVLADEVKRTGAAVQVGAQQRSQESFVHAVELARNERIGKLRRIEVGIHPGPGAKGCSEEAPPEGLDYEMWLGPAPEAPYCPERCRGVRPWMYISDYSGGRPTEWGSHHLDIAHWGMNVDDTGPLEIESTVEPTFPGPGLNDTVMTWRVQMRYPGDVLVDFADNLTLKQGIKFIGDDGWVFVNREEFISEPAGLVDSAIRADEIRVKSSRNHGRNWLECIKSGEQPVNPVEAGHRTATACHITNICLALGRKLQWNPEKERFVDDEEANAMISRKMRGPWHL